MKKIQLFAPLLILLICFGCPETPNGYPIKELMYEAMTRGSYFSIHIKSNILTHKTHKDSKEISLNKKQLKDLDTVLKKIKYTEVSTLKAPSDKRLYDGAFTATITFTSKEGSFQSSAFDDDNPPQELKELVTLLEGFIQ